MRKKSLVFFILLLFCWTAFAGVNPEIILEGSLEYNYRNTTVELYYPVILEIDNKDILGSINKTIKDDVFDFYNYFLEFSRITAPMVRTGLSAHVSYEITLNRPGLLSLNLTFYQYTGGAHGMHGLVNYTYDTETGRRLGLGDLFDQDFDYLPFIQDQVLLQVKDEIDTGSKNMMFFDDALFEIERKQDFNYYLTDDALYVYFDLYEIAPYASGMPKFRIPFERFDNHLAIEL